MTRLDIHLLGEATFRYGGRDLGFGSSPRLHLLAALLVLHRGKALPRAALAYRLWPDSSEAKARANLRRLIHNLHEGLPDAERFVQLRGQSLLWYEAGPYTLDVAEFERQLAVADAAAEPTVRQEALERAVRIYRGDLLPGFYEDGLEGERERLRGRFGSALEGLARLLAADDPRAALEYAERVVRHDPLDEAGYRLLMDLYSRAGAQAKALHVYHRCATQLQRELEAEPGHETRALYNRLQRTSAPVPTLPALGGVSLIGTPFVGRRQELARLQEAWQEALTLGPRLVLVGGDSGIGKTRLVETWANTLQGPAVAAARCYAVEGGVAYAPVTDLLRTEPLQANLSSLAEVWLTELVRLLPELYDRPDDRPSGPAAGGGKPRLKAPEPLRESWQRLRFLEALAHAFSPQQPLVLLLDDLHECDRESLEWLHYLLRFDPKAELLVVGTYRPDEVSAEHPLASLRTALAREGRLSERELGALGAAETASLAEALNGSALGAEALARLYRETEGVPLFVVETMRQGGLTAGSGAAASALPVRVRALLEARLTRLSDTARGLAEAAAVLGSSFDAVLLGAASQADEASLVGGLDELWRQRIVREERAHRYRFSHDKLREVAYDALSPARRRLLHRRVGEALAARPGDRQGATIAHHFDRAAEAARALPYYAEAAEAASALYATAEARGLRERALALFETLPAAQAEAYRELATDVREALADLYKLGKAHDEARALYTKALEEGAPTETALLRQVRLRRKFGTTYVAQYRYPDALAAYSLAEATLDGMGERSAPWWREWLELQSGRLRVFYWLGRWQEMDALIGRLEPPMSRYGGPSLRAKFYQSLVLKAIRRDRYVISAQTLEHAKTALAFAQKTGQLGEVAVMRFALGICLFLGGDFEAATAHIGEVLELAERTGDRVLQVRALAYLSQTHRALGHVEETRALTFRLQAEAEAAQMTEYAGVPYANLAWLARLEGRPDEAERCATAALERFARHPQSPLEGSTLFPLLALTLEQGRLEEALGHARRLLAPEKPRLPDALTAALRGALEAGTPEAAERYLHEALGHAKAARLL